VEILQILTNTYCQARLPDPEEMLLINRQSHRVHLLIHGGPGRKPNEVQNCFIQTQYCIIQTKGQLLSKNRNYEIRFQTLNTKFKT